MEDGKVKVAFALNVCEVFFSNGPNQTKDSRTYSNKDILKHQLHHLHYHHLHENLVRTLFPKLNKLLQEWGEGLKQRLVYETARCK